MKAVTEDPALRRARAHRIAVRAETDCAAQNARPDLLLRAAWHRLAAGDTDLARAQAETLLARADVDPTYAPPWLVRQAGDLLTEIDRRENGDIPADQTVPRRR